MDRHPLPGERRCPGRRRGRRGLADDHGYIRGTAIIAFVDALGVGIALIILGIPLAFPLTLLIFFGAFIPSSAR